MRTLLGKVAATVAVVLLWGGLAATTALAGPETAGASTSKAPITIGIICACSGYLGSDSPDIPPTAKAWVDSVNAAGGINGHKVVVLVKDDAGNPATSTAIAQTFIKTDHVVAIIDATALDQAWASYVQSQGVPVIGAVTSSEPFYLNSDFYPESQTEDALFDGITAAVHQAGGTKFALFYCAEAVQCQEGIAPLEAGAKSVGEDVVAALEVAATAPNYTAQCIAAKNAGATVIFLASSQQVDTKVIQDCYAQGYKPKVVIDGEILLPSMTSTADLNQATYFTVPNVPYFSSSVSAVKAMDTAIKKYAPGTLNNATWGEYPMFIWISGELFQAAAVADHAGENGAVTSAEIVKGLDSLHGATLDGLAPPLTYKAGQPNPVHCWYYAELKDGKFTTPYGLKYFCAKK
ncbi:MAG: ABC transporter substrate-binding protein [Acidimicrobiales bacterium]